MNNSIEIVKAGLFTTIQDKGRWNYQRFGMPVAGAMDHFATRVANMLVGNDDYDAVLEITFMGPKIQFNCDEIISITGANMGPRINQNTVPMWTSIKVKAGDVLSFDGITSGLRSYIAFSRGLDVPEIMGSKSTYTRGKLGGYKGRKLADGDIIPLGEAEALPDTGSYLPQKYVPIYKKENTIRVVMGPQDDHFTKEGKSTFLNFTYNISSEADRMGYRLEGPKIEHKDGADIISDGIVFGSVQVPGHGLPIIMMADRQTTGGYTKIATVITPDLSTLAQMSPGSTIKFKEVSVKESHGIYREYEQQFKEIKSFIESNKFYFHTTRSFNVSVNGIKYNVSISEI